MRSFASLTLHPRAFHAHTFSLLRPTPLPAPGFDKAVEAHNIATRTTTMAPHALVLVLTAPRLPLAGVQVPCVCAGVKPVYHLPLSPTPTRYTDHHHLHAQACRATASRRTC